ncbi:MAG: thioredoxin family protein [Candidatus Doudnabacteria bacterium]|nr:thioredoxin family protein [Candidatus Doudnabacteria bacterium]
MNYKVLGGILIAAIIIGGVAFAASQMQTKDAPTTTPLQSTEQPMDTHTDTMDTDGGHETPESMAKEKAAYEADKSTEVKENVAAKPGEYLDYSPETLKIELAEGHKVVLFFHAPWCPFCKTADAAFKAKLDQIPTNVVVLKTDYDSNSALKQKYGVTYQHTFVQIDANGNMVSKWNGGDVDSLKKYLK